MPEYRRFKVEGENCTSVIGATHNLYRCKLTLDDPDMGLWSYTYDALGNLTQQTDARGCLTSLAYDGLNRLTGKTYSNASGGNCAAIAASTPAVTYGYDAGTNGIGQRTSMSDGSGSTSWTYDPRGRAISESRNLTGIGTFNTAWSYNSADLLSGMQYPENNSGGLSTQVASTYHPQLTLNTLGSYVTGTTYDAAGRITSRLLGSSGLRQDFAYTAWNTQYQGGKLDTIKAGTSPNYNNLQNLDYGYDKVGNILTILDAVNSSQKQCFTYDALNRLTRGTTTNDTQNNCGSTQLGNGNYDQSYSYDTATGNLSSKAGVGYTYGDASHEHAVTHLGGVQKYWYDTNGNQVTRIVGSDTYNLAYDAENRLVEVKKNNTTIATFVYDGDGNRVKSTLSSVTTAFIGSHTEWVVSSGSLTRYFYAGSTRVAMRKNNTVYYLLGDHLGSTSVTTDQNGQNLGSQYYLPWGEVRYSNGTLQTKYTYTGQYSNVSDFGLMYYKARWYDPYLNRWTQPDIIIPNATNPQSWDRYSYVNNNPVNYSDPSGHRACESRDGFECDWKTEFLWGRAENILGRWGGKNDLLAMVKIISEGSRIYQDFDSLLPALSEIFIGSNVTGPGSLVSSLSADGCAGIGRDPINCDGIAHYFTDRGFHPDFQDSYNQVYHLWGYISETASPGNKYLGEIGQKTAVIGNNFHEIIQSNISLWMNEFNFYSTIGIGTSWEDYVLSLAGMEIGALITNKAISPGELSNFIYKRIGPEGVGSDGYKDTLYEKYGPLAGKQ